ncbi:MGMT family protein [Alkanindiges illinoisensis]|uniref:MGMT family protein n=1 Tax=Alkanindiges illinoisensis TaxID=197183 RepID=UPI000478EF06|nr:MGMT family protein [Alkanindiges illinoisensis]
MNITKEPNTRQPTIQQDIFQVVALIPYGKVATYGQVAALAGYPRHARLVGYALNRILAPDSDLPWHRVINAQGRLSLHKLDIHAEELQRFKLEQEGVVFAEGRVNLKTFQWQP